MERRRTRRYHHREKTWMEKFKDYLRQFIAFLFSNVGIIGLVVGYTITGAFIFIFIEKKEVSEGNIIVMKLRNETVDFLWNLTYVLNVFDEPHWKTAVSMKLMDYQEEVVKAISKGFDGSDNNLGGSQWSFSGAFLYSLTVITTIGYGNVTPRTEWGKLATILYAIIGMPLFLLYLSNIGDVLAKSFKWTYAKCFLCKGCTRREIPERHRRLKRVQHSMQIAYNESPPEPSFRSFSIREDWQVRHVIGEDDVVAIRVEQDSRGQDTEDDDSDGGEDSDDEDSENEEGLDEEYDPQTVTVPLTLCLAIMVGYVCFGALLFSKWENWGFLDGSYFCFISLSTIGFGDIVPGDKIYKNDSIDLSFIFCSMYLMLGMALIAMSFNLMQEEVVHKIRTCCRTFKFICGCHPKTSNIEAR